MLERDGRVDMMVHLECGVAVGFWKRSDDGVANAGSKLSLSISLTMGSDIVEV